MSTKLILTLEGDTTQLLAFVFRLKPILADLNIDSTRSETVTTPECPACARDLELHKGYWTCVDASCARYGDAIQGT